MHINKRARAQERERKKKNDYINNENREREKERKTEHRICWRGARARVCVYGKKQEANEPTEKNRVIFLFFSSRITQISFVFTYIRTKRHTKTKRKKKMRRRLAA